MNKMLSPHFRILPQSKPDEPCPECKGVGGSVTSSGATGYLPDGWNPCPKCKGIGKIVMEAGRRDGNKSHVSAAHLLDQSINKRITEGEG